MNVYRIIIYTGLDTLLVLYSSVFSSIQTEKHLFATGRPLPGFTNGFTQLWWLGLSVPFLSVAGLIVSKKRRTILMRLLPDLLIAFGVVWLIILNFAWELPSIPFIDLNV